jgi:predicted permease
MTILDDVRYAARGWRGAPAVSAAIVTILTIGIGANAVMFGVVDRLLLRPPSGIDGANAVRRVYFGSEQRRPGQLVGADRASYLLMATIRDSVPAFAAAAATHQSGVTLGAGADARPATVELVNAAYFATLGIRPAAGRFFTAAEDTDRAAAPVAVVSYSFWRGELGGNRRVVGTAIRVEGMSLTIVGVAPRDFVGVEDTPADLWVPVGALAPTLLGEGWASNPGRFAFRLIARLLPDATPQVADAQALAVYRRFLAEQPDLPFDRLGTVFTAPLERSGNPNGIPAEGKVALWLLGVAVVVLLVAAANAASLLLARMLSRRREIAIRLALGISRGRLLRLLLVESTLLVAVASAAALGVTFAGGRVVQQVLLPAFPWGPDVVDLRVLVVTLLAGALGVLGAGLAPALQALSTDVNGSLRSGPRVAGGRIGILRTGLLVGQVSLCVVLLIGAGLFVRSLMAVRAYDVGVDLDRVIQVRLPQRADLSRAVAAARYEQARARIAGTPGVERVTLARGSAPMAFSTAFTILPDGWTIKDVSGRAMPAFFVVEPGYFETLGARVERGRGITDEDERSGAPVAVINRALAEAFWPDRDPLGQCVRMGGAGADCTRVVGIVQDILFYNRVDVRSPQLYVSPAHPSAGRREPQALLVRTVADARPLVPLIRETVQSLSPDMPFVRIETMATITAPQLQPWRLGTTMFLIFGGLALLIAAVGLASTMAHTVSQRSHEIGIRMALGASRWHIVSQIGRRGAVTVAAGTLLGLLLAASSTPWIAGLLYETSPRDPLVFASVATTLALAGVAAAVVPARRSASIDPIVVLKAE